MAKTHNIYESSIAQAQFKECLVRTRVDCTFGFLWVKGGHARIGKALAEQCD